MPLVETIPSFSAVTDFSPTRQQRFYEYLQNAKVLETHGEYEKAELLWRQALNLDPYHSECIVRLAKVCWRRNKKEEAIQLVQALHRFRPQAQSCYLLAQYKYTESLDVEAQPLFFEYIAYGDFDPERYFQAYKNLGNIFVRQKDYESAEEYYNKAYCIQPASEVLMVNFATLEIQRSRYDLALTRIKEALDLNPKYDQAWIGLALLYRLLGEMNMAWGCLENALDYNSQNRTGVQLCAQWSVEDQKIDKARQRIEKYLRRESLDIGITQALLDLDILTNQRNFAALELEKLICLSPETTDFKKYNELGLL